MIRLPPNVLVRMQSRAGLGVAALDAEHALGVREVPLLAAVALLEPGDHELRAHRAVAEQRARSSDASSSSGFFMAAVTSVRDLFIVRRPFAAAAFGVAAVSCCTSA